MWQVLQGNALDVLKTLESESVHCCVTSPPYWGLRSYLRDDDPLKPYELGSEATPEEYVQHMVEVFREVKRVLRRDGMLWVTLGDAYAHNGTGGHGATGGRDKSRLQGPLPPVGTVPVRRIIPTGLKPKDLVGIPWRVAFALQADGWYLRMGNVWYKPNALPESVEDRPTKAHEYVFLFVKSGEPQFWTHRDLLGVRTEKPEPDYRWIDHANDDAETDTEPENWQTEEMTNGEKRWSRINLWRGHDYFYDADAIREPGQEWPGSAGTFRRERGKVTELEVPGQTDPSHRPTRNDRVPPGRNKRSVWIIPTHPFPGAHFATYPPDLVEICIKAGTSAAGCCPNCGAPWVRITEEGEPDREWQARCGADASGGYKGKARKEYKSAGVQDASAVKARILAGMRQVWTIGWQPTCSCDAGDPVPCTVLDPFAGAGTTLYVAEKLGRNSIGIELNPSYIEDIIKPRMASIRYVERPMFA